MNDPILVRRKIRQILSALPPNRRVVSEEFIADQLNRFFPEKVKADELRTALEWNHARGLIEYLRNHDEERDDWYLTESGRQKEGCV